MAKEADNTHDMFEGYFDNTVTRRREYWQDGQMRRCAAKNMCGTHTDWDCLNDPWGTYPDRPENYAHAQQA